MYIFFINALNFRLLKRQGHVTAENEIIAVWVDRRFETFCQLFVNFFNSFFNIVVKDQDQEQFPCDDVIFCLFMYHICVHGPYGL